MNIFMPMKKIFIILCSIIPATHALAQNVDYSLGNNNPFIQYQYKTDAQWEAVNQVKKVDKSNSVQPLANPLTAKNSKYKNLLAASQEMNGCWDRAASTYGVDPWLLMAIAQVESGFNKHAINKNSNASIDLGMMQINSIWLPTLRKYNIDTRNLFEPCTSVFVGAWIVAHNIRRFGYNQDGIGAYNSPSNIKIRRAYAQKVYASYQQLIRDFQPKMAQR